MDVFLKSILTGWVDRVFHDDPALGGFRRQEHERVLEEFRELDRNLLRLNAQRISLTAAGLSPLAPARCRAAKLPC